ncbi:MAG TPA: UvrD-helicase domain-containing protein [Bryobacteraceae bacterium]|nr:UvrD-helicase domain-containing protein [Bryobacteraceae bacterium]
MSAAPHTNADAAARERIRNSLGESLIVEASAGTGKTSELIRRIVRVLAAGTPVDQIVAVTFTHKAAGELKIRLREELDKARAECTAELERAHLEDALERLEEAAIGTIHGFCAQILRERPVEARIDPGFEELTEPEADRVRARAFDLWFQRKLDTGSEALRRALARLAWRETWGDKGQSDNSPVESLRYAGKQLVDWRDHRAPWRRESFDRGGRIRALLEQCRALDEMVRKCTRTGDNLVKSLRPLRELSGGQADDDTLEARLLKLERDLKRDFKKGSGNFAPGVSRQQVLDAREALLRDLDAFRRDAGADFAAALRDEMQDFVEAYREGKKLAGKLDFLDLLLLVRDMVRDNREVRNYLQNRYSRIFVDEFQDTDPLQAEILILLSAADPAESDWMKVTPAPGKLFVVGDPKQSIYKFRRADVVLYENLCAALASRGVARIHLTQSFRAVPAIQQLVNAAFAPEMTGDRDCGQARYAPLEEYTPACDEQPAVVVLPAPKPYGMMRISKEKINDCLPDAIAAYIDWLRRESGWKVRDPRDNRLVPLEARHICVLFRRLTNYGTDLSRDYTRALEARGIPHLLVGSKSFYHRDEVETVRVALAAIEWPDDELSVYGALRGSLFAIPDDLLLRFRFEVGRLHPFRRDREALPPAFASIAPALAILAKLHRDRNHRPVADTINELLETTRAHAGFTLRRAGSQALANVYRICDLARTFELTGGLSFRGFVEELAAQAEKSESTEAPVLEEASDGVRLMTVHGAKGLEFPVVILADMTANLAAREAERFVSGELCAARLLGGAPWELLEHEQQEHARELAEGVRVAYVAATRARDLLVIPGVGDEERDGWLGPLNKAIYPARGARRIKAAGPGCPSFAGECTVLERPSEYSGQPEASVHPGLHRPQSGDHRVVWWDPGALRLSVASGFGLRQEDILAPEPAARAAEGINQYREWQEERRETIGKGCVPAFRIVSPTDGIEEPPERRPVHIESVSAAPERSGGSRFGILVHTILRDLDLAAELPSASDQIAALARVHARLLNAPVEEADAAVATVEAAWAHPLLARARASPQCHREFPIHLRLEDGRLLEGVADLAFLEQERWVVVDFKTDAGHPARYERQLQWYLYALSKLTGRDAAGFLLRI